MDHEGKQPELLTLTAEIVAAFASNNTVAMGDLPGVISSVFTALRGAGQAEATKAEAAPAPAVPIRKSVTSEFLICLEDGKKLKMLKRHLKTRYNMTPEEYRRRWGLPRDYPMVAPAYAEQRSSVAKRTGLGRKKVAPAPPPPAPPPAGKEPGRRATGAKRRASALAD
jgi:predicted transcriptional regulator